MQLSGRIGHGASGTTVCRGPGLRRGWLSRPSRVSRVAGPILLAAALGGCAASHAAATPPIKLASAFVIQTTGSHVADGYVIIQNSGPADALLTASSSAGGTIILRGARRPGAAVQTVSALNIPGHSIVRLNLAGVHFVIQNPGKMVVGTDIELTLNFAHAGKVRVPAQVTDPENGNTSYFGS